MGAARRRSRASKPAPRARRSSAPPAVRPTRASTPPAARPTRDYHPAQRAARSGRASPTHATIPRGVDDAVLDVDGRQVKLTNLRKPFWPELGVTKGDLLQYYADIAEWLLPHIADRAMVMKRYPHGAGGEFFFMKRAPSPRPAWIETCAIAHASGNVIDFPVIQDLPALLWVINLGCIDLNQWYARCDDVDRPDYFHVDLDPGDGVRWEQLVESALVLHEALRALRMPDFVKTTGSRGIHVYVPIVRGPTQHEVWEVAKAFSNDLAKQHPKLLTAVYTRARRPAGRVLVDFNQNAWGRTLASIYSVRPHPRACVSTPVTWDELPRVRIEDFRIDNVPARVRERGDLWAPLLAPRGRYDLRQLMR